MLIGRRDYIIATRNGLGLYRQVKTVKCMSVIDPRLGHAPPAARMVDNPLIIDW